MCVCVCVGGGLFGPHHQTGSQNSGTLSPRVSKISDFFLCLFDTLWGLLQSFFEQEIMKNKGYDQYFLFKMTEIYRGGGGTIWGQENNCWP